MGEKHTPSSLRKGGEKKKADTTEQFEKAVSRLGKRNYVLCLYVAGMTPNSAPGHLEPQEDLRGASGRSVRPQRDRRLSEADPCEGGADHRRPDADQEASLPMRKTHRRHVGHGQGHHRPRYQDQVKKRA